MSLQLLVPGQDYASGSEDTSVCDSLSGVSRALKETQCTTWVRVEGSPRKWGKPPRHELACANSLG